MADEPTANSNGINNDTIFFVAAKRAADRIITIAITGITLFQYFINLFIIVSLLLFFLYYFIWNISQIFVFVNELVFLCVI